MPGSIFSLLVLLVAWQNGARANWWYLGLEPRLSGSVQGAGGGADGSDGQQGLGIAGAGVIGPASAEKKLQECPPQRQTATDLLAFTASPASGKRRHEIGDRRMSTSIQIC